MNDWPKCPKCGESLLVVTEPSKYHVCVKTAGCTYYKGIKETGKKKREGKR